MKNQRIPEHTMNFTGEVGQALENTKNIETQDVTLKEEVGSEQINLKEDK